LVSPLHLINQNACFLNLDLYLFFIAATFGSE
jgi:hypothetical protein